MRVAHGENATGGGGGTTTTILSISCGEPGCDRAFGSESARASHRRYTHGDGDPLGFPCRVNTCAASFGTLTNRDEHMREVHPGPRETTSNDGRPPEVLAKPEPPTRAEVRRPKEPDVQEGFICTEIGCTASFDTASKLGTHRWAKHRIRAKGRTPPRTGRIAEPDPEPDEPTGVVTIMLSPSTAKLLLDAVLELGDKVDLDFTDPASLRREADRIELEQAVKAAVSA